MLKEEINSTPKSESYEIIDVLPTAQNQYEVLRLQNSVISLHSNHLYSYCIVHCEIRGIDKYYQLEGYINSFPDPDMDVTPEVITTLIANWQNNHLNRQQSIVDFVEIKCGYNSKNFYCTNQQMVKDNLIKKLDEGWEPHTHVFYSKVQLAMFLLMTYNMDALHVAMTLIPTMLTATEQKEITQI